LHKTTPLVPKHTQETYKTLYVPSGRASATCNCIIMVMPRMLIDFRLTAMAPKASRRGMGKATARANMTTSVINRGQSLDPEHMKGFISEHIRGLIRIFNVCGIKNVRLLDVFYDIIFLTAVTTRHISQSQLMWPHSRSRSSPFWEWWAAYRSYIGICLTKPTKQ
jgi:hypothetical protein